MTRALPLLQLAARSAWNRRFVLSLVVASIALSTLLLLGIERIRNEVREGFSQSVSGTDLIVGARTGRDATGGAGRAAGSVAASGCAGGFAGGMPGNGRGAGTAIVAPSGSGGCIGGVGRGGGTASVAQRMPVE